MTSLSEGRSEETARRRERVLKAVAAAVGASEEVSVSAIARAARVDRSFFYRHRDLLERIHAAAASPSPASEAVAVTRASLQADLANALERNSRLTLRVRQLERRLSESLGEQVWRDSGLSASVDIDQLQRQITALHQQVVDLQGQLDERTDDLQAARAANRELTRALNQTPR
ncbi:DUF6262 family protein [Streptomyces xanthophaeus]|uniref:DUF6262 family protein n=1 Tax=Streptomyces xanthophaeus TaxID=67385 RepID=UPI0038662C50|nr:DUF6262 family protein [Streptomyces xanthophaeus]WST60356.1 DUF6262 family protein [Streptomyces xanthophaeus]